MGQGSCNVHCPSFRYRFMRFWLVQAASMKGDDRTD